ncbi:MAG: ABC transporter ATP-binding protein [Betaproteobacteria bacterium]|jgi:multiple sugar transport system ATP-binding protein|nr:ABC transporter ATP-binding protein [Burkholderiales bacterium]NBX91070.1 ABC transporter ATP-binding protein [Betaproteobacteria bacterium]
MGHLSLHALQKNYGSTTVIHDINLEVQEGEFLVLVGPSGCGKSTLLRMIAGLESITQGDLLMDGVRANEVHPADRGAAMVFQNYALYPHMTVAENMGFSLRMNGIPKVQREQTVARTADILKITHLLPRLPKALSGGERQRVAIGRAIVRKPKVFLFDEPLSNLDAALRVSMRIELSRLHKELGSTMVYVTHDQVEAMTMGDRIAVMHQGRIAQIGKPMTLYKEPINTFVASFLGAPTINLITRPDVDSSPEHRSLWQQVQSQAPQEAHQLGVRPENLKIAASTAACASLVLSEQLGDACIFHLRMNGLPELLTLKLNADQAPPSSGQILGLALDPLHCMWFDKAGQRVASPHLKA